MQPRIKAPREPITHSKQTISFFDDEIFIAKTRSSNLSPVSASFFFVSEKFSLKTAKKFNEPKKKHGRNDFKFGGGGGITTRQNEIIFNENKPI